MCPECKGTGTVTLLTTSGPCKSCVREDVQQGSEVYRGIDWGATAKAGGRIPVVRDSREQRPLTLPVLRAVPDCHDHGSGRGRMAMLREAYDRGEIEYPTFQAEYREALVRSGQGRVMKSAGGGAFYVVGDHAATLFHPHIHPAGYPEGWGIVTTRWDTLGWGYKLVKYGPSGCGRAVGDALRVRAAEPKLTEVDFREIERVVMERLLRTEEGG